MRLKSFLAQNSRLPRNLIGVSQGTPCAATANSSVSDVTLGDVDPKIVLRVHFIDKQGIHKDGTSLKRTFSAPIVHATLLM